MNPTKTWVSRKSMQFTLHYWHPSCYSWEPVMNEERIGLWIRQTEHSNHLWHRYSVTVNPVIMSNWTRQSKVTSKKSLKIPKGQSESVYRRTDNTMAKRKVQKGKQRSTKHTYKTKDRVTRTPLKTEGDVKCFGRVGKILCILCCLPSTHVRVKLSWIY